MTQLSHEIHPLRPPSHPLTCEKKLGHGLATRFKHKQDFEP